MNMVKTLLSILLIGAVVAFVVVRLSTHCIWVGNTLVGAC